MFGVALTIRRSARCSVPIETPLSRYALETPTRGLFTQQHTLLFFQQPLPGDADSPSPLRAEGLVSDDEVFANVLFYGAMSDYVSLTTTFQEDEYDFKPAKDVRTDTLTTEYSKHYLSA